MKSAKQKITQVQKDWHYIQKLKIALLILRNRNRVIKMEVSLQEKDSVTVINAYASTSSAEDEKSGTIL